MSTLRALAANGPVRTLGRIVNQSSQEAFRPNQTGCDPSDLEGELLAGQTTPKNTAEARLPDRRHAARRAHFGFLVAGTTLVGSLLPTWAVCLLLLAKRSSDRRSSAHCGAAGYLQAEIRAILRLTACNSPRPENGRSEKNRPGRQTNSASAPLFWRILGNGPRSQRIWQMSDVAAARLGQSDRMR